MSPWVYVTKPNALSLISRIHLVEREPTPESCPLTQGINKI